MRRSLGSLLVIGGALAAFGCGGDPVAGLAVGGNGNVVISVGTGTTPSISWTGGNATRFSITQASGGGVMWNLHSLNTTGFAAPLTFGVVPSGAAEDNADAPLSQGTDYRVNITLADGSTGSRIFRP